METSVKQTIVVIGSGAREHAWAKTLLRTNSTPATVQRRVYVCPGNSGMREEGRIELLKIDALSDKFVQFCKALSVDLVVVGPEQYLMSGVVDRLSSAGIVCFGPERAAAKIEGSKLFCKDIFQAENIPTAPYWNRPCLEDFLQEHEPSSIVIKASGLAAGKGVVLPSTTEEVLDNPVVRGEYGPEWFIESRLFGEEVSVMAVCNGFECQLMPQAQDYKRVYDGDQGPNTGGMGAVAPVHVLTSTEESFVHQCLTRIVKRLQYRGILYAGLMKTSEGVFFLECNCRLGDPEAQVLLSLVESDLYEVCRQSMLATPDTPSYTRKIQWKSHTAVNIVLSHEAYPGYKLSLHTPVSAIPNLKELDSNISVFSGNIRNLKGQYFTTGGRVASVCACVPGTGPWQWSSAVQQAYDFAAKHIQYEGKFYRRDIGQKWLPQTMPHCVHIAVLGSTRGSSLLPILDKIRAHELNAKVSVVLSNRKSSQLLDVARSRGIPTVYLPCKRGDSEYDRKIIDILRTFPIDVVFLVGYMKIVSSILVDEFQGRMFNIHPSLLPKFAGGMDLDVHQQVIQAREQWTGCTLHYVSSRVDEGAILSQRQIQVNTENSQTLKQQVQALESECLEQCLKDMSHRPLTYKTAGVDIDKSDSIVDHIQHTTNIPTEHFGATFDLDLYSRTHAGSGNCFRSLQNVHPLRRFAATTDGVGTKLEIASELGIYNTIGIDLVAMSVNDLYAQGVKPLYFLDYLALDHMDVDLVKNLLHGVQKGCEMASCDLIGGETAEMRDIYRHGKFDMAGFAFGEEICTSVPFPRSVKSGNILYGLQSSGFHSNGYTLVRRVLERLVKNGDRSERIEKLKACLTATRIYSEIPSMLEELGENLRAMAHITGGGITDNIARMLPRTGSVECKLHEWTFPPIFQWIQKEAQLSREDMLNTFNCGYGFVCILNSRLPSNSVWNGVLREIGYLV